MIYLQLIILRLRNYFSYFWKPIVYYNCWKLILHLITLPIYCWIKLIRILVTYWVVNSPLFSLQFQIMKNDKFWEVWCCVVSGKRSLVILGIGWSFNSFIFIGQLALCTWGLDLFLLNYWRSIHKEFVEVFWIYLI